MKQFTLSKAMNRAVLKPWSTLIPVLFLTGCSQIPVYEKPKTELPDQWQLTQSQQLKSVAADESVWWKQLCGDSTLDKLIAEALENNQNIALARVNLEKAVSVLRQSQSGQYPSLDANAGLARTQSSDQAYPLNQGTTFGDFSLGALLSYEIDLWGKVDASVKQSEATLKATQADEHTLKLSISAAVAKAYLNLMALNQSLKLAQNTVQSRKETLELRQTQLEYGSVTPLTVYQAESELAAVQISLHQLEEQRDLQLHALGVLVGRSPKVLVEMSGETMPTESLAFTHSLPIPKSLPSDLLNRRPDIYAAEQRLIAANANIGVAKAALFPSISLTGLLGFQSEALSHLFDDDAVTWNASAGITAPIFDYGRRKAMVRYSEADKKAMVINYQQTVRNAFREVLDALTQLEGSSKQLEAQKRQVTALMQTLDLAQSRFDAGYSSYLEVLDAQRNLFNAELAEVTMKLNHSSALVSLYKALGGSWVKPEQKS
ncbi:efflux transporter outer membrane subunit [Thiomicrorhabdus sp. ZW0627]|uniref:efflux transporter outer membrane subunit n=1 Tax=Thiomicrorhabdus sp. ZW0627 TaxID=3039774 RepID=UPI002436AA6E|nr:efflux transporter outer membrane subunit [Thiomicrorhabdus sp. ZW0627]MDG6774120.1 efflux transporter outer membrane subunit [Thiomicrorhabdus sp. ZW0627]